ncbi:hypothetical protein ACLB2K_013346 [Fragaria x ananassa]
MHMEAEALRASLLIAIYRGWKEIEVESDCETLLQALAKDGDVVEVSTILVDCCYYLMAFDFVLLRHVNREANGVANKLAHLARSSVLAELWEDGPPDIIHDVLIEDGCKFAQEMDIYAMKRRKLQGLCKKHGIRANMKNIEMAERLNLLFKNKQEDEKSVIQVDVDQVESYRSSADEVESATTVSWISSSDSISGDDKTAERIAYTWKMGEDSSSKDIRGESLLFSISSDGHRHSNDAADITGPGGMEVGKENTVDDTDGFGMMEVYLVRSELSMLKREMGVDFPTDSPVTASDFETKALELEAASPILNNFGLKGLLKDDQTSGLKKSGLEMSEGTSKSEYIEDVKNVEEFVENTHVVEELNHQEHNVMGEVLELKSTPETSNHCHIGPSLIDTNVCIPSFWDDSKVKPCTDNTCGKPETCSGGAFASVLNVFPPLGNLCGVKENNVVVDKVSTGSSEAIIGIKNVSDGIKSVEKTAQGLDDDSLLESEERHSACVKSFSDISRSWTETYSTPSLQNVSLSCGVLGKIHLSVQEGNDSIYLKPGRVSGLKFKGLDAGIDDSRHEMDFFAMQRKRLQALCKEHGIRANLKNTEMAERLSLLFNEDEKSMTDVELVEKQLDATETVTAFVESPKVKKVKFSPNNETFYFVATDKDSDSDSDCDYSPKKKPGGRRKSRGERASGKKEVPGGGKIAREVEAVEIKDIPVRVLRSRKPKVVSGAVELIVSPGQVMSGVENVHGNGIKPVKFQNESNAIVLRKGKVIVRDDARKRTRNENSEEGSQVVPTVEAAVENGVILPKPPLRRSKRKTTLFSSVAGAEKEFGISEAVETVKLGREPVTRKDAAKPRRRSNRNACKKVSAEISDDMTATVVEMDGPIKENQEPSLLEGSSLVVYESLDRSTVLKIGKEVEKDVARKRPRSKEFVGNSKVEPSLENEVLPPKRHSRRSNSRTASLTELTMPLEESKIDVGSEVQPVGNEKKTGCCFNKEAVEKSRKKRKGSRKKIDSATEDHPDSFAISTVYSDFEKRTDVLAYLNENQLVESVNFQGTSMFHKEHNAVQPIINHTESTALEDAFFSKSSIYSNSTVGVMEDIDQENTVEQNPLASPDKLSNVVVSSKFACVRDVRSITYGPVCEGQTSNFLDLNGESETEELVVKSISRIGGVLDNQLANGVKGNVSEDQKSIGTTVMVQVKMESRKPAEAAAETIGEMHLDITVPSDTTLTPLDASAVKKADGDGKNSSTSGVSCTNGEYEQGVAEQDVGENSDGHVEIMHSENAMDDGDGKEIFENGDQHGEQSILEGNERLKEENIVSAMIQEYADSEKDRNDHLEVTSSNISIHKEMFSETAENQRASEVTELESQDEINFGSPKNCKQISSELEKCASAASSDSISRDDKTAKRIAYA